MSVKVINNLGDLPPDLTAIDQNDRSVQKDGGRVYTVIGTNNETFSCLERVGRIFLGLLAVLCTLGLALLSGSVRDLFTLNGRAISYELELNKLSASDILNHYNVWSDQEWNCFDLQTMLQKSTPSLQTRAAWATAVKKLLPSISNGSSVPTVFAQLTFTDMQKLYPCFTEFPHAHTYFGPAQTKARDMLMTGLQGLLSADRQALFASNPAFTDQLCASSGSRTAVDPGVMTDVLSVLKSPNLHCLRVLSIDSLLALSTLTGEHLAAIFPDFTLTDEAKYNGSYRGSEFQKLNQEQLTALSIYVKYEYHGGPGKPGFQEVHWRTLTIAQFQNFDFSQISEQACSALWNVLAGNSQFGVASSEISASLLSKEQVKQMHDRGLLKPIRLNKLSPDQKKLLPQEASA